MTLHADRGRLEPGNVVGSYVLVGELGRGGMGVVWRARDRRLGRDVALKTMLGSNDLEATERFVREARAAARLRHPGIVQVLDAGSDRGVAFVAFELVEGGSLAAALVKGPLPPVRAAALVRDLALAVGAAHAEGIVHRDLKPANVLLDRDGRPRLADFGLARDARGPDLTETGATLGTPAYMAPEQATADREAIGPRTDVYGLGAVLYHALAGEAPFQGGSALAILNKVLHEDVASPSARRRARGLAPLPGDLETIVLEALAKSPARRYATAEDMSRDLARFLDGEPIEARPPGPLARATLWARRNRGLVLVAALGLAGTVGAGSAFALKRSRDLAARDELERSAAVAAVRSLELVARAAVAALDSAEGAHVSRVRSLRSVERREALIAAAARALVEARSYAQARAAPAEARRKLEELALRIARTGHRLASPELAKLGADELPGSRDAERELLEARADAAKGDEAVMAWGTANALYRAHKLDAALKAAEASLRAAPDFQDALVVVAKIEAERGDLPAAIAAVDRAIAADPDATEAWCVRAELLEAAGRLDEAETAARRSLELDPTSPAGHVALGKLLRQHGDYPGARAALEKAVALDRTNTLLEGYLGEVHLYEGHVREAIEHLTRSVDLEVEPGPCHVFLGVALARSGDREGALAALRPLAALPGNRKDVVEARRLVAELERR